MKEKLAQIFNFLNKNRVYNKELQERFYSSIILPYNNDIDRIESVIYHIANTQSQPRIDYLAKTYKYLYENRDKLNSFGGFVNTINPNSNIKPNYRQLFNGMRVQKGWGDKTSALLVKTIFHLHNGNYSNELRIWSDVPKKISDNDEFFLPVDSVIIAIFEKIDSSINWNFTNINKELKKYYSGNDIEVWDDLWFWGFITQNGTGKNRLFEWNENKYWTLKESDKRKKKIEEIKIKAEEFLLHF